MPREVFLNKSPSGLSDAPVQVPGSQVANRSRDVASPPRLVRETALEDVRNAIGTGALKPGSRLTEKSICERFGVSRTLAREIVRKLETERLIDVIPHRGLRIAVLTPQVIQEIYAIRAELEVMVVRAFIAMAKEDDMAALIAIHATLLTAANNHEVREIITQVTRFLRHLIEVSASKVAGEVLDNLLARINLLRIYAMSAPGQLETSVVLLNTIIESIVQRDPAAAEVAVRVYVQTACKAALLQVTANVC